MMPSCIKRLACSKTASWLSQVTIASAFLINKLLILQPPVFVLFFVNNKDITVENEKIYDILKRGELLFTTKLRNCMMHYNLENAGVISIENIDKPFYGIIENCFNGKSYKEYLIELHGLSDMIINFLNSQFDFSDVKIRKL